MKYKSIVFIIPVIVLLYFSVQVITLNDDFKVLEKIRSDPQITYTYIKLEKIETMAGVSDTLIHDPRFGFTLFVRQFVAYRDPPDTTPLKENSRIIGYVDMNLKVWYVGEFRGDQVIL
jgi:hypothetical protein